MPPRRGRVPTRGTLARRPRAAACGREGDQAAPSRIAPCIVGRPRFMPNPLSKHINYTYDNWRARPYVVKTAIANSYEESRVGKEGVSTCKSRWVTIL